MLQPAPNAELARRPARTFGYARVSTDDKNLAPQLDALRRAGCDEVFENRVSGQTTSHLALDQLLPRLRWGDALAIWNRCSGGKRSGFRHGVMLATAPHAHQRQSPIWDRQSPRSGGSSSLPGRSLSAPFGPGRS